MKTYDIIIPHYNGERLDALALECVRSIRKHSADYRVIWVQNGGQVPQQIRAELGKCEQKTVIANKENVGFVKATNQGIATSDAPFVVLMNNDTEAVTGWLSKMRESLTGDIGIVGPLSTARRSWQGQWSPRGTEPTHMIKDGRPLAFFCVMLRRDVIEKVGTLDDAFGVGLGDDDDYSFRVRRAGFKLALRQDLVIPHHHRSTFRALYTPQEIHAMQYRALDILKQKARREQTPKNGGMENASI